MTERDTTKTPPLALIRWWFGKTKEERQAFLETPTTSAKAQENIRAVEAFSQHHSYFVACETNLEVCPLPPLSPLPSPPLRSWGYRVRLPCVVHGEATYGGRYSPTTRRFSRQEAAQHLLGEVYARVEAVLRDYGGARSWCAEIARVLVDALAEASVAALCRLGLLDTLEALEAEAAQASARGPAAKQTLGISDAAPKPAGVCRAESYGCVGVWMLLRAGVPLEPVAPPSKTPRPACAAKRPRVVSAGGNRWQLLREQLSQQHEDLPSDGGSGDNKVEGTVLVPHTAPRITISAVDMRFGIAKALGRYGARRLS